MNLLLTAKIGGGVTGAVGVPASIYFAHNYMTSFYEVENKVIEENVGFSIEKTNSSETKWTIKVNSVTESSGETNWNSTDGYYWECIISGPSSFTTDIKSELSQKFPSSSSSNTNKADKEKLVAACAGNRVEASHKQVKAKFDFPENITAETWKAYLIAENT